MKSNCLTCKKELWTRPSRVKDGRGKYCSKKCGYLGTIAKGAKHKANCVICSKEFKFYPSNGGGIVCSVACRTEKWKMRSKTTPCLACGKEFRNYPSWERKYCSNKCFGSTMIGKVGSRKGSKATLESRKKMSDSHMGQVAWNKGLKGFNAGEKHPNWKGGITSERAKFENQLRQTILERDNYTCRICYKRGGVLHIDHIQKWSDYIEGRFDINNCRTLCQPCHYEITFGRPMPEKSKAWANTKFKGGN